MREFEEKQSLSRTVSSSASRKSISADLAHNIYSQRDVDRYNRDSFAVFLRV